MTDMPPVPTGRGSTPSPSSSVRHVCEMRSRVTLAMSRQSGQSGLMTNLLGTEPQTDTVSSGQSDAPLRRRGLAVCAGAVACAAIAGAIGAGAGLDLISTPFRRRLPFQSPVALGGCGAQCAWRGDERADPAAITAGGLTMGWVAFETTIVREPSVFDVLSGGA